VGDQSPGKAVSAAFYQKSAQALDKKITIFLVKKNICALDSPHNDVL
jgi:hypothetical protein